MRPDHLAPGEMNTHPVTRDFTSAGKDCPLCDARGTANNSGWCPAHERVFGDKAWQQVKPAASAQAAPAPAPKKRPPRKQPESVRVVLGGIAPVAADTSAPQPVSRAGQYSLGLEAA